MKNINTRLLEKRNKNIRISDQQFIQEFCELLREQELHNTVDINYAISEYKKLCEKCSRFPVADDFEQAFRSGIPFNRDNKVSQLSKSPLSFKRLYQRNKTFRVVANISALVVFAALLGLSFYFSPVVAVFIIILAGMIAGSGLLSSDRLLMVPKDLQVIYEVPCKNRVDNKPKLQTDMFVDTSQLSDPNEIISDKAFIRMFIAGLDHKHNRKDIMFDIAQHDEVFEKLVTAYEKFCDAWDRSACTDDFRSYLRNHIAMHTPKKHSPRSISPIRSSEVRPAPQDLSQATSESLGMKIAQSQSLLPPLPSTRDADISNLPKK